MKIRSGTILINASGTLGAPQVLTQGAFQTVVTLTIANAQVGDVIWATAYGEYTNAGVGSNVAVMVQPTGGTGTLAMEGTTVFLSSTFAQAPAQVQSRPLFRAFQCVVAGSIDLAFQANSNVVNGDTISAGATFRYLLQRFAV